MKQTFHTSTLALAALLACSLLGARPAAAGDIAFDVSGSTFTSLGPVSATFGYAFTVTAPVTIDTFLFYDAGGDGLGSTYDVSIYLDDGTTTLAHANLQASFDGSESLFDSVWREIDITDTVLGTGDYTIIASTLATADNYLTNQTITPATGLTYGEARFAVFATGVNPTVNQVGQPNGYFGPNFTLATAVVPVPAAAWLALPLLAAMGASKWRRRVTSN